MFKRIGRTIVLAGLVVLAACATSSTKLTQIWTNPGYTGAGIQKILIIGMSDKAVTKRLFENRMSALFHAQGVEAEASFEVIPAGQEIDKDLVRSSIEGKGYDSVLVTRLISRETEITFVPGSTYVVDHWGDPYYNSFYPYYTRTYQIVHEPGYIVENEIVRLETNVYDVATESLTWAAVSETFNPDDVAEAIDIFGLEILAGLAKQGLVQD